ncbi:MAG: substrate-binding domain-containing protein [Capsulimonadaceae bacterium]|nr:substrate-binding domain-containing protein [Capsulimonadaceae bacterium]
MDISYLSEIHIDREGDLPLYAQLRDALRDLILSKFEPGDPFYSDSSLMEHLPVSQITVRRALAELTRDGFVSRRAGAGSVVASTVAAERARIASKGQRLLSRTARPLRPMSLYRGVGIHTISVISNSVDSEAVLAMTEALRDAIDGRGFKANILIDRSAAESYGRIALPPSEEAVILFRSEQETVLLNDALSGRGYKTVAIDMVPRGYPGAAVQTDPVAAMEIGVEHLTSLGHERITLVVNEPIVTQNVLDKVEAFEELGRRKGFADTFRAVIVPPPFGNSYSAAYDIMPAVWDEVAAKRPTAIMTVSDPGAWAVAKWLAQQSIGVPQQVSVLGFEDAPSSKFMHPSLSTIAHPIQEIAACAIDILCSAEPPRFEQIPPTLIVRETTGPVSAG